MIIVNFPLLRALDCQRVKSVFNFLQISHGRLRMFHLAWHMPSSVGYSVHLWQDIETIRNIGNHSLCQSHTTQWKMPYWGRAHIFRVVIPASTSAELAWLFWLLFRLYCVSPVTAVARNVEEEDFEKATSTCCLLVAHIIEDMSRFPHTCSIIRVHM